MPKKIKGGHRPGAGRPAGIPNRATRDIKALAQVYTAKAIEELAKLAGMSDEGAGKAESEQARIAALKELLDRGHGKATQAVDLDLSVKRDPANYTDAELAAIATGGRAGTPATPNGKAQSH